VTAHDVTEITDEVMGERLAATKEYTLLILKSTPRTFLEETGPVIWEHGRRNMALNADGILPVVCPVTGGGEVAGIGIFDASLEAVNAIMSGDPAVEAGVLTFELHPVRGFPGAALPA
jgi:hypothetical protein